MKTGDIWLAQLDPTVGREIQKTRPCVVISPNCLVPGDHIPRRSYPLLRARGALELLAAQLGDDALPCPTACCTPADGDE
ncbi:type II toxin-antitoxin system PemK/MazF family toxin [Halochromatium salexigens]|uniref:Type II toxin-antitoxin system PemK/MazF family toxin n=1 Tax=Halochromatium salexigens TaxID=49447 RepID=A0AAJ0XHK8_HALSE|nr:type II toxin-antitoxin system PemK/MazF family toxin [Halochromatium salexigens]MBK5931772.1 hypothetical protein [Halochromatium salexigens]